MGLGGEGSGLMLLGGSWRCQRVMVEVEGSGLMLGGSWRRRRVVVEVVMVRFGRRFGLWTVICGCRDLRVWARVL